MSQRRKEVDYLKRTNMAVALQAFLNKRVSM